MIEQALIWSISLSVLALSLPTVTLIAECLLALPGSVRSAASNQSRKPSTDSSAADRPPCVILIPAHNEEQVLPATLASIKAQVGSADRILVIADNCSDSTVQVAAAHGVEVLTRESSEQRGKGYAMQFGIDSLRAEPPAIVVFLDADCRFDGHGLERLVQNAATENRAVQACYLMHRKFVAGTPSASMVISQFAVLVKNRVRPRALNRLGIGVPLTGSGMAFPWHEIASCRLGSANLVEDMALSCDLTSRNRGARFCEDAVVTAPLPSSNEAALEQRRRWEHGHLDTISKRVIPMVSASIRQRSPTILGAALDLAIPPLTLLLFVLIAVWVACLAIWPISTWPLVVTSILLGALALSIGAVAIRFSDDRDLWKTLWLMPVYAMQKSSIYLSLFLRRRQREWVRTAR